MKKTIKIQISCGKTTCASKPGEFCRFLILDVRDYGTCSIFKSKLLPNKEGWIGRCQECIQSTKKCLK
jgi:hypothetical protein